MQRLGLCPQLDVGERGDGPSPYCRGCAPVTTSPGHSALSPGLPKDKEPGGAELSGKGQAAWPPRDLGDGRAVARPTRSYLRRDNLQGPKPGDRWR